MRFFSIKERLELAEQHDRQCHETRRQLPASTELQPGPNSEEAQREGSGDTKFFSVEELVEQASRKMQETQNDELRGERSKRAPNHGIGFADE